MKFEEYRQFDAIGLADLVARGEVTAAGAAGTGDCPCRRGESAIEWC